MIATRATRFVRALLILIHLFDVIDKTTTSNDHRLGGHQHKTLRGSFFLLNF